MEESPATERCIPQNSKKRVFPESSSCMEAKSSSSGNRTMKNKNKMIKRSEGVKISSGCKLDSEDKGTKTTEPAKATGISVGFPSVQLPKEAKKVRSVKKLLKGRQQKMPSGPGGSSSNAQLGDHQNTTKQGQTNIMEDVTMHQDSGDNKMLLDVAGSSSRIGEFGNDDEVQRKYRNFKKFDIVVDHSDHHYSASKSAAMQPTRKWAKKIQDEWRILEKALPDAIFVRVYESRMDLLRAVIMGAEGTPYHDGLFFFDVCFPKDYPSSPPRVYYHSGGLRINPNLYNNGKVCLSLLNTWTGAKNETWRPEKSTMLQVLVSIQGLVLNAKPYFNEPGDAPLSGSNYGERQARLYNEHAVVLSLKTMVYTMKKPSKHFEDLVIGHFRERAHDILKTCRAYTGGLGVGRVVEEGSLGFRADVERYMKTLIGAFKQIGVEDVDEFLPPTKSLSQKIKTFFASVWNGHF